MKRMLSLITIMCMLLTCVVMPVSASDADITVTLSGIADGDIYEAGSSIIISAQTNMADVKNIDIYANDDKLPGTIIGDSGAYVWYAPASGSYAVKAVVATSENSAADESEAINIVIKSNSSPRAVISGFNSPEDAANWTKGDAPIKQIVKSDMTTEYPAVSPYSFRVTGPEAYSIYLKNPTATTMTAGDYIVVPFYNASDVEGVTFGLVADRWGGGTIGASTQFTLKKGWNFPRLNTNGGGGVSTTMVNLRGNGYGGEYLVANHGIIELYVNGAYVVNSANNFVSQTLAAESTSIPDKQENVCNDLKKYRINFNEQIIAGDDSVTVTKVADDNTETAVEGYTVTAGNDYIDVVFAEGSLDFDSKYKVAVNNTVVDVLGLNFAGAEYTFKTIADDCTSVKPIVDIVYPADGASVTANTKLAAKVIFRSNVSKVEFFNGDTSLGEATAYTNGEYQLDATLAAAETYSIKAVATLKDNTTIEDTIALTGATATDYAVIGIGDGERILVNNGTTRKITVIDASKKNTSSSASNTSTIGLTNATNVNKVEFYVDGAFAYRATSAPYSYDMPLGLIGAHDVKVCVYDNYGNTTEFEYDFTTVLGILDASDCTDFEEPYTASNVVKSQFSRGTAGTEDYVNLENDTYKIDITSQTGADGTASKVLDVNYTVPYPTNTAFQSKIKLANLNNALGKIVHYEFDIYQKERYGTPYFNLRRGNLEQVGFGGNVFAIQQEHMNVFKRNQWYNIAIDIDVENKTFVTYIDDVEFYRGTIDTTNTMDSIMLIANYYNANATTTNPTYQVDVNKQQGYYDNIKAYSYTVVDTLAEGVYLTRNGADVFAYNNSDSIESLAVFEATYTTEDDAKRLNSAALNPVSLPAYGIFENTYTVPSGSSLFIWNGETLAPLADVLEN